MTSELHITVMPYELMKFNCRIKTIFFLQIVLPALFIAAAMAINLAAPTQSSYNPRVMSFSMFKSPNYIPFEFKTPDKNVSMFNILFYFQVD